ncbi:hypothetical protein BTZ20_0002 [Rhodococcus sp. MTM3W5.2]|nr:hypothetical protein BTZ20_0002 [Rhodococcus sp. MTM3W5.2]
MVPGDEIPADDQQTEMASRQPPPRLRVTVRGYAAPDARSNPDAQGHATPPRMLVFDPRVCRRPTHPNHNHDDRAL